MKKFFFLLHLLLSGTLFAGEKIYLCPTAEIGIFSQKNGVWHKACSSLKLSCGESGLLLDAVLTVPPGRKFRCGGADGNEMAVFKGEVFEFQIAPAGQGGVYYHFAISPSSHMYTAKCRDMKWNPSKSVLQSTLSGNEWRFRLSVPYQDIGARKPAPGEIWKINLARLDVSSGPAAVLSSIAGASNYHDISQYAEAVFFQNPPEFASVRLQDARLHNRQCSLVFSSSRLPERGILEYRVNGTPVKTLPLISRNGSMTAEFPLPIHTMPIKNSTGFSVSAVLKNAVSGHVVCRCSGAVAMEAHFLMPDRFYYTAADKEIRFSHKMNGAEAVSARLYDDRRQVVAAVSGKNSIPLAGLRPGRYVLELSQGGIAVSKVVFLLDRKPDPGPLPDGGPLRISGDRLYRGGRPVFLLGLSPTSRSFLQFPNAFNFSYNRSGVRRNSVVLDGLPGGKLIRKPFVGRIFPPDDQYFEKIAARVRQIPPDQPAVWRISYEAQIPKAVRTQDGALKPVPTDEFMLNAYRTVKKAAPGLIYSIQTDNPAKIGALSRACDVFEVAFYTSSYAQDIVSGLRRDVMRLRRDMQPGKPVIFWLGGTIPNPHCRLAEEIRCGVYFSILNGFSGNIIHMGHGFLPESRTRLWSLLSGIHAEVESFYADFAEGEEIAAGVTPVPEPFVGKAVRTRSGSVLLMVINMSPVDAVFPAPAGPDYFTAYEPKVYRLAP